jgi:outer membrane protein OmpA-like peptidoglycan-associated protein
VSRAFTQALVLSLAPLGTAYAQLPSAPLTTSPPPYPYVRVTHDNTEISSLRQEKEIRMRAPKGTVLEVFLIEGDRYNHRDSNWYWVMLPNDKLGNRPVGWIRGDDVEHVAPPVAASTAQAQPDAAAKRTAYVPSRTSVTSAARDVAPAPIDATPMVASRPIMSDVVLNFLFGRRELTDEAKRKLATAVPTTNAQGMVVEVEGHADWVGTETYNSGLGLARAESVRRYLAEQFRIPVDRISVVSYGENNPAATNATREGRAQNRRVVIKAGA